MFGPAAAVETTFDFSFSFDPAIYPANWYYSSGFKFDKHCYTLPGEMLAKGEEYDCAFAIENTKQVRYWVRNLSGQE